MRKSVLITGATGTLGRALSLEFAKTQHDVAMQYRSDSGIDVLIEEVRSQGVKGISIEANFDFEDIDGLSKSVTQILETEFGGLDIAVLNASSQELTAWNDLTAVDWDAMYVNSLRHTAVLLKTIADFMQTRSNPVIVVVGSIEGIRPNINHAPYGVFKAALHHLVTASAYELGKKNIRVVGVAPGLINREGLETDWKAGVESYREHTALHRLVEASEVAKVIRFLASDDASALTGITIPVDAGWSTHPGW